MVMESHKLAAHVTVTPYYTSITFYIHMHYTTGWQSDVYMSS